MSTFMGNVMYCINIILHRLGCRTVQTESGAGMDGDPSEANLNVM